MHTHINTHKWMCICVRMHAHTENRTRLSPVATAILLAVILPTIPGEMTSTTTCVALAVINATVIRRAVFGQVACVPTAKAGTRADLRAVTLDMPYLVTVVASTWTEKSKLATTINKKNCFLTGWTSLSLSSRSTTTILSAATPKQYSKTCCITHSVLTFCKQIQVLTL